MSGALHRVAHFVRSLVVRAEDEPGGETPSYPRDFRPEDIRILERVRERTMTSPERVVSLIEAVRYLTRCDVEGAFVECGVWRGGSMMAAALTLLEESVTDRELFLFDTFAGMTEPDDRDVNVFGGEATPRFEASRSEEGTSGWCAAGLDDVRAGMASTGYPEDRIHYVEGRVEDTIPDDAPEQVALLRLDTDWYQSTRHELIHLYPRLSPGGVLIIDDYGHWLGAREAVDEFIEENDLPLLLHRIDYTGRMAVKPR